MIFENCRFGDRVSQCYHVPRCGHQVPGDRASAFGRMVPDLADLAGYLTVKHAYEAEVGRHHPCHRHGDPWPESVTRLLARTDALKEAGGPAEPGDPVCCQRYGRLHEPAFSVGGCRWLGVTDPGHQADVIPQEGGGYLVTCPAGCNLGTSALARTEDEAGRRVRLHMISTKPLGVSS
jgi:hypothetical protein